MQRHPSRRYRVALLDDYQHLESRYGAWGELNDHIELQVFHEKLPASDLAGRLTPFDILVLLRERTAVPAELIEVLPNLKLVVTTGPRNAVVDGAAARRRGIPVCATRHSMGSTIEFAWALILACTRQLVQRDAHMRRGGWQPCGDLGLGLRGHTLGILGLGEVGKGVARIARIFDMNVLAWSSNLTTEDAAASGATRVDKDELFRRSDVITVHMRLSDRTVNVVGPAELALMKPAAFLVNTSRGPLVDESALIDALQGRRIAGAALDVFDVEPLPAEHPLRGLDNVTLSPHLAALTSDHVRAWFADVAEDIRAWLGGTPVRVLNE